MQGGKGFLALMGVPRLKGFLKGFLVQVIGTPE
jgi:hypothetical protein